MSLDPGLHRRKSIRIPGYDYARAGAYFITACTRNREPLFGDVVGGVMRLNAAGEIAATFILDISRRYSEISLDCFVVMPNHIHMVLVIGETPGRVNVGAIHELPLQNTPVPNRSDFENRRLERRRMLIPMAVGYYRMNVSKRINVLRGKPGIPAWQRNYHEHVVRTGPSLERIRAYIRNNPAQWTLDRENPDRDG